MPGDRLQRVVWALDHSCPMRTGSDPKRPCDVEAELESLVMYEEALREGASPVELLDDVLITGTRPLGDPFYLGSDQNLSVPETGWCVSSQFRNWGGAESLFRECGACQVNPRKHRLAGCHGSFYLDPDSVALNELLVSCVGELGLGEIYRECFDMTNPLYYGLWTRPTMDSRAQSVMLILLDHLANQNGFLDTCSASELQGLKRFCSGLKLAHEQGVMIHVELLAPGRQVLDVLSIFPHCPACRASALDQPWQRPYPSALQLCSACGMKFSPSETASSQRVVSLGSNLYDLLREKGYRALSVSFLARRACPSTEASAIVDAIVKTIEEERVFEEHLKTIRDRQREFLRDRVYAGLASVSPPPSDVIEVDSRSIDDQVWFESKAFELVLERAMDLGVTVRYMSHIGKTASDEKHIWEQIGNPLIRLKEWTAGGCQGKFSALLIVPNQILDSVDKDDNEEE